MNIEGPPVKAVLESIRRRPTPQSSLYKAVPECMRSKAPAGTPLQPWPTWLCLPAVPPAEVNAEVNEMEVEDKNPPLDCARRSAHRQDGKILGEKSESR